MIKYKSSIFERKGECEVNRIIGVLAHVDAGKTTFCEQLLYHVHKIRSRGRVDHADTFMDHHPIERRRGMTIFSEQAQFLYREQSYTLLDTPGHVDFAAEMERALCVLDAAILIVSCVEGVQAHTQTLWNLLREANVPTFFFLNKIDRIGADVPRTLAQIRQYCSEQTLDFTQGYDACGMSTGCMEEIAQISEPLLERYLSGEQSSAFWHGEAQRMIQQARCFPCFCGAALLGEGVMTFFDALHALANPPQRDACAAFCGQVTRVRHDVQGNRVTFLKVLQGTLRTKDEVPVGLGQDGQRHMEKVDEIRRYDAQQFRTVSVVQPGDLCGVTGLRSARPGDRIGALLGRMEMHTTPTLMSRVLFDAQRVTLQQVRDAFLQLEEEDPQLQVQWEPQLGELRVRVMGRIQLEVLQELARRRFDLPIDFGPCEVLYKETIASSAMGFGHFEPLRHYAEVHLFLSPGAPGSGITFQSGCPTDLLPQNFQHLVQTHVREKQHIGLLIGAPLTDVVVTLCNGRAHEKHTEGGDFREATYRAIRHALHFTHNVLLEPYDAFTLRVPTGQVGRALSDLQKLCAKVDAPQILPQWAVLTGRGPVSTLMDYGSEILSYTGGTGVWTCTFWGYAPCHNAEEVIAHKAYDVQRDVENTADSVFCARGAGYPVKWQEVASHIHCEVRKQPEETAIKSLL